MDILAFVTSTLALFLYSLSYFFNDKKRYLAIQLAGNVFLSISYLFIGSYFTMVSIAIGIARGLIFYIYEKKNRSVPISVVTAFCSASILSYIVINHIILSQSSPWDVLYLIATCLYAISFAIRNIRAMRYVVLVPHSCAVVYNLLIKAPISSAISYGIELTVTVVAIVKYEIQKKRKNL